MGVCVSQSGATRTRANAFEAEIEGVAAEAVIVLPWNFFLQLSQKTTVRGDDGSISSRPFSETGIADW